METVLAVALPLLLTAVGLYLGHALHRRMRLILEERRLDAYLALWPVLRVAASTRNEGPWAGGPLTEQERKDLFDATTDWYYGTGEPGGADSGKANGPFLTARARKVYFPAKRNLICPIEKIQSEAERDDVKGAADLEAARGRMSIRQFSVVRWVMRFDIRLHTEPYFQKLDKLDLEFLDSCGINWEDEPFRGWTNLPEDAPRPRTRGSLRTRARAASRGYRARAHRLLRSRSGAAFRPRRG